MLKKIIVPCIFIGIILSSFFPMVSSSSIEDNCSLATLNGENKVCKKSNEIAVLKDEDLSDKYPTMVESDYYLENYEESPQPKPMETPEEFNWADYDGQDWTTPAKNQDGCGSCWGFAALAVLESMIEIREDCPYLNPDFSEQYLLSCFDRCGSCRGGSAHAALIYLINDSADGNYYNGIIPEECFPYLADDTIPCSNKCENWVEKLIPIKECGYWRPDGTEWGIEAIKTEILQRGPVVSHIKATDHFKLWGALHHDPTDVYHEYTPVLGINHVITIVGWKDTPSISSDGYWICKNSWGIDWGYDGFFNIEYGGLNVDSFLIIWADYDADSHYWLPKVESGGPYGGLINQQVTFDGSNSESYENEITEYIWDFGDGTTGQGMVNTHAYTELGNFDVKLTVIDEENKQSTDETYIVVQEKNLGPEKPMINGPGSVKKDESTQFTFKAIDPEANEIFYLIDWDDNSDIEWIGPYSSNEQITLDHMWETKGQKVIRAKVKDVFDNESSWSTMPISIDAEKRSKTLIFNNFIHKIRDLFPILDWMFSHYKNSISPLRNFLLP